MRKTKKLAAALLSVVCASSSVCAVWAASSDREAWNNAAGDPSQATTVKTNINSEETIDIYPNVYANADAWNAWKEEWENIRNNFEQIALTPGADATQMNAGWYTYTEETPSIRLTDENGNPTGTAFYGTQNADNAVTVEENGVSKTLYPSHVTLTGLTENTTYYYQYLADGQWSDTYSFKTQSTDAFSFLYVGDPQIGASTGQEATEENNFANPKEYFARNDAYNWNQTLTNAYAANPDVSFIMSAGDQINQTSVGKASDDLQQQVEYAGFLYSPVLRSLPVATTIGNHDSKSVNYQNHFNNPNSYTEGTGASVAGSDYYFTYGNTLFVVIDTNNYNCQTHKDLIDKAIAENPDVTWKVLMFHQDIYGSGYDHSDSDGMILRTQLTPIIDEAGFDAVLQGHDHTYSRTYQISASDGTYTAYDTNNTDDYGEQYQADNAACYNILSGETDITKVVDPEGCVYFEANSSSGSKFYQLIGTQQDYIAARNQSWRPTYSVVEIDEVSLTVRTYDAATGEELVADGGIATAYTIVKSVDKTNLETILAQAKELLDTADVYTEESLAKLAEVYEAALAIYDNAEASSVDVASAYTSVDEAIKALAEAADEPSTDEPSTDEPSTDEPSTDEPSTDEPSTDGDNSSANTGSAVPAKAAAGVAVLSGLMLAGVYLSERKTRSQQ